MTPPASEWGRRLSDAIRAALDASDLARARTLTVEGDGQARSLEKEYALMYRGLGITVRVLLDLLGKLPARPAALALLGAFRRDMLALMEDAYDDPGARPEIDALAAALAPRDHDPRHARATNATAAPSSADVSGALEETRRVLTAGETLFAREQARLAGAALAAIDAGDAARARRAVDRKERAQYVPLHDRIIRFMAETFGYVLRQFGPEALLRFQRDAAEGQRDGFERWERMTAAEFARATAFLLKQHMGQVEVREDGEKFTVVQAPCGSGGRLRLIGAYDGPDALPFVESDGASGFPAGALTHGERRFPVYCSHCPVWNGLAPVEWFGHPHWVFERPSREDGSCTLHVYKQRDAVPRDYRARLGVPEPPR